MTKFFFYTLTVIALMVSGCQRDRSSNDFFSSETPSTVATFTLPTGTAAQATPDLPYSFSVTISGINGFGELVGSFVNATDSVDFTGLSIVFSPLTEIAPLTYQSTGTISGPFTGNGTVTIELMYNEQGIIIFENVVTFVVTIQKLSYRSEDTPVGSVGTLVSAINVPVGLPVINDVRVRLHLLTDLPLIQDVILVSPSSTQVQLHSPIFFPSAPDMAVIFDDLALLDITTDFAGNSPPPFVAFRPEEALSVFDGEDPSGNWILSINDGYYGLFYGHTLVEWAIAFNGDLSVIEATPTSLPALSYSTGVLNLAINDTLPPTPTISTITVPAGLPLVTDLRLRLDITHVLVSDLVVLLASPNGTIIDLSMNDGGAGQDMQVILDDDVALTMAADFVGSSGSPFAPYVPVELLAGVDNESPAGAWTLIITDTVSTSIGTLNGWALAFNGDTSIFADF